MGWVSYAYFNGPEPTSSTISVAVSGNTATITITLSG